LNNFSNEQISLSIIIPVYNEEKNILPLYNMVNNVCLKNNYDFEIIFVNDGSTDNTQVILNSLAHKNKNCKVISMKLNFGQTAVIMAGINNSIGKTIILMDGDLQNDPEDIPRLLEKLEEGYDVCSGWRKDRKDPYLTRKLPSQIANLIISKISGTNLKDYGCTLKAYRRDVIKDVKLYGEMHRFIPIYASWLGAKTTEIAVNHRPRIHGKSNYGLNRIFKVILDLIVVKFLSGYSQKPIYIFGGFGLLNFLCSMISFGAMLYYKFWGDKTFVETPLPLLVTLFFLMGFFSILTGLLAEMISRTYHESQGKPTYLIKSTINIADVK
tara:strand:+ start:2465 stop:3442 length:978 start_codon:yes stop_codon:yes gene_type:complete